MRGPPWARRADTPAGRRTWPRCRARSCARTRPRSAVPRMDIDREVAAQLAIVNTLLPQICEVAAQGSPSFR
jgi:hypothetical protein